VSASLEPPFGAADPGGMGARIAGAAAQIDEALAHLAADPWRPPAGLAPSLLAVGGLGGSAIAADLVRGFHAAELRRPMLVVRDERWPACVDRDALALLSSYSGNTGETLALYDEAALRGSARLALTTGGALAERAKRDGVACMMMPGGSPPRAALYGSWVRVSHLLHALGWIAPPGAAWREAAEAMRAMHARVGPEVPEPRNAAKQLARALHGRLVLIYSPAERLGAAGLRWRQQLNENAKLLAHAAAVPELTHNEIVGWERRGAWNEHLSVVVLRDRDSSAADLARLALTADYAAAQGARIHEVDAGGEGPLARLAGLVLFGDWVSFYLAILGGADPTAIPSIDAFKRRMSERAGGASR
jgi:glucose/mannose-6-phosphate isomerase